MNNPLFKGNRPNPTQVLKRTILGQMARLEHRHIRCFHEVYGDELDKRIHDTMDTGTKAQLHVLIKELDELEARA
jgi:hypothetical protein